MAAALCGLSLSKGAVEAAEEKDRNIRCSRIPGETVSNKLAVRLALQHLASAAGVAAAANAHSVYFLSQSPPLLLLLLPAAPAAHGAAVVCAAAEYF